MPVNNINSVNSSWGADALKKTSNTKDSAKGLLEERSGLSVDDFLKIMAAEMQNQNPMGGSEGGSGGKTDYVSQLAQFTSLELMTEVVENLNYVNAMSQQQYAFTLIGKEVTVMAPKRDENGNPLVGEDGRVELVESKGTVQSVKFKEGIPMANVRDEEGKLKDYELGNIMEVAEKGGIIQEKDPVDGED